MHLLLLLLSYIAVEHSTDMANNSAAVAVTMERTPSAATEIKKVFIHPPSAKRIMLPDGRYLAYKEQGVPADRARFAVIMPHTFLSSRLAGTLIVKT